MKALFLIGLLSTFCWGNIDVINQVNFCEESTQERIMRSENNLAFTNHGGLVGGGVCWWHSRFTRNANNLAVFAPNKIKPHQDTIEKRKKRPNGKGYMTVEVPAPGSVKDLINKIRAGKEVVEIPGYNNLEEFSRAHYSEIQSELEAWQIEDGFIKQKWIVGLAGGTETEPEKLRKMMDELYLRVKNGEVVYQKLQLPGIVAHAWLVPKMEKTKNGYKLTIIDSNYKTPQVFTYRNGDTSFYYNYFGKFVPYTGNEGEERRLSKAKKEYCDNLMANGIMQSIAANNNINDNGRDISGERSEFFRAFQDLKRNFVKTE